MNKVQYQTSSVGRGVQEVKAIQTTPESDWRDDEVMQRSLACVRALTDHLKEPMVVLLQMQHDNYLNKSCYAAAAAHYPRPCDLETKLKRGDFDLLFLHRERGLVVAEIKSVGWRPGGEQDDATVVKKVRQAVDQLVKARTVLSHLVSDLHPLPRITPTLILPNVPSNRLKGLLRQHEQLAADLCACFSQPSLDDAINLCLCSEQMTSLQRPADVTPHILQQLTGWWRPLLASGGTTPGCSPEIYELLVARFCGPASTVQVHCVRPPRLEFRTLGHAVQEVGERMVEFVLFPEQLALLQELDEECVYLSGPPGTGKTLLLMLVALQWSRAGRQVHVVSTGTFSEAATHLLYYQVTQTLAASDPEAASRVQLHLNGNNTQRVHGIVSDLIAASRTEDPQLKGGPQLSSTVQNGEQQQLSETGARPLSNKEGGLLLDMEGKLLSEGKPRSNVETELSNIEGKSISNMEAEPLSNKEAETPPNTETELSNTEAEFSNTEAEPSKAEAEAETLTKEHDALEQNGGGQLYLIVDEVGEMFREFYDALRENVRDLHMWAASYRKEFKPIQMEERTLSACLRSTPTVMRRMETAISFAAKGVDGYADRRQEYLNVSDGPAELFLSHEGHSTPRAMDCEQCGHCIAQCLHLDLGVAGKIKRGPATSVKTPSALRYSDVMIIPDYYQDIEDLRDDDDDDDNTVNSPTGDARKASGIVRGLRAQGVPVYVVRKKDAGRIGELARAAREAVAVVGWGVSNGLERKVVVSVGQGRSMGDGRVSGVLHGASRCVSQLVYVKCPES
ncbi:hypothetical protein ACOMHN_032941 [Nucella lapillus]